MAPWNLIGVFSLILYSSVLCFEVDGTDIPVSGNSSPDFSSRRPFELLLNTRGENFPPSASEKRNVISGTQTLSLAPQNVSERRSPQDEGLADPQFELANLGNYKKWDSHETNGLKKDSYQENIHKQIASNSISKIDFGSLTGYFLNAFSNVRKMSQTSQLELIDLDILENGSAVPTLKKYKVGLPLIEIILSFIREKVLDLAVFIKDFYVNFSALPIQPELVESSLSPQVLEWLTSIETNFQKHLDTFVFNFFTTWAPFFDNQTLDMRFESIKHILGILNEVDAYLDNLGENSSNRVSLNDVFDHLKIQARALLSYFGSLNYDLNGNQTGIEDMLSGKILAHVCESLMRDEKMTATVTETLHMKFQFIKNIIDRYVENDQIALAASFFDPEFISQIAELACFYATEVPRIHLTSEASTNESNYLEASVDSSLLQRGMFIEWYKYFDIYFLAERLKELPFMTKEWDLKAMLESVRKSVVVAWMALLQSDPKDIAVALYGDLLPSASESHATLRLKCSSLISELQDFQNSAAADMEELIRTLLRQATELQCYRLGPADPVLRRLQFLLSMLRTRRNVAYNPFDPLNVARGHMVAAEPPPY